MNRLIIITSLLLLVASNGWSETKTTGRTCSLDVLTKYENLTDDEEVGGKLIEKLLECENGDVLSLKIFHDSSEKTFGGGNTGALNKLTYELQSSKRNEKNYRVFAATFCNLEFEISFWGDSLLCVLNIPPSDPRYTGLIRSDNEAKDKSTD